MRYIERIRFEKQQEREAARLAANLIDRAVHPELWEPREIPAVWNHSDLESGDHERDGR
jgi:hypothetical protein